MKQAFRVMAGLIALGALAIAGNLQAAEFHVAPAGNDGGAGTPAAPFATLERVRDAIRQLKKAGPLPGGATVGLHGGTYFRTKAFDLSAEDSGTQGAPIIYRAAENEPVRLCGARAVSAADFRKATDPAALARIQPQARGKIFELDLKALGIRHRSRYPDVFTDTGGLLELYFNGQRMPLSRFPNEGYMTMKRVVSTAGGIQDSNWREPTNVAKAPKDEGGTFEYREEFAPQHERWQKALDRGVWLKGYWRVVWQNEAVRVKCIDAVARTVTFAKAIQGGIGSKYHRPQGSGQEQYWLMNLLEEVDMPGEWCVDFKDEKLYFYPPAPLEKAEMLLADMDEPLVRITDGSQITLRGLTVEGGLGHAIVVKGGSANLVAGCTVRNQGKYAVQVDGGTGHAVQSCDLYELGAGGVWLSGGEETKEPRTAAGHRVVNNHIHHFARIERVYAPGVNCGYTGSGGGGHHPAVGMYVAHNLIHDTPHAGVLFGSWDTTFEFNEILRFCEVSNDMGGFYSYDKFERMGNLTFRYNLIHFSADGDGIYFDLDHRDMHIYGNVIALASAGKRGTGYLYKIGTQGKNPQKIDCYNNIAVGCNYGFVWVTAGKGSKIQDNVAVACKTPFTFRDVKDGKEVKAGEELASGKNVAYDTDPGFVDARKLDFRLNPDSKIFKDLPGFKPIPVEKIGLYVDEYRKKPPTDAEVGRFAPKPKTAAGYEIWDRN